jgi:sarcosine oxidase subunit beta
MAEKHDVVIIGAGVIGCSLAHYLCQRGISNIAIIEKEHFPGTGSTSKAFAGIRAQFTTEANISMSLLSMKLLDEMDEDMASQSGYLKAGYLFVTAEKSHFEQLQRNVRFQQQLGVAVQPLSREEIAERFRFFKTDDIVGGSFGSRDGFIDPGGLTNAFYSRLLKSGAKFLSDTLATGLLKFDKKIVGVVTDRGEIRADIVVNAAGAHAGTIAEYAGVEVPVQPIRSNIAVSGPTPELPRIIPMIVDIDAGLLIRREGEGIGYAWTNPDEPPGFNSRFDADFIELIAPKIERRFPNLIDAGINFSKCWAGLYPETPDHHAILGESGVPGFLLAAGFGGHGIMHGPAAGKAMSELIATGKSESVDITPFSLERFKSGKLNLELAAF